MGIRIEVKCTSNPRISCLCLSALSLHCSTCSYLYDFTLSTVQTGRVVLRFNGAHMHVLISGLSLINNKDQTLRKCCESTFMNLPSNMNRSLHMFTPSLGHHFSTPSHFVLLRAINSQELPQKIIVVFKCMCRLRYHYRKYEICRPSYRVSNTTWTTVTYCFLWRLYFLRIQVYLNPSSYQIGYTLTKVSLYLAYVAFLRTDSVIIKETQVTTNESIETFLQLCQTFS